MTEETNLEGREFKHGDITCSPSDVPTVSLFALAQRGFSHVLGNEVAAKVANWKKSEEGATADEATVAKYVAERRAEALEKIMNGTLGVRAVSAPRVSSFEALMRKIAVERLVERFAKLSKRTGTKVSLPTGDKVVEVAGRPMTREQFIEAELKRSEEAIKAEAHRRQSAATGGADEEDDLASLVR